MCKHFVLNFTEHLNATKLDIVRLENKSDEVGKNLAKSEETKKKLEDDLSTQHKETANLKAELESAQKQVKETKEQADKESKAQAEIKSKMEAEVASLAK